MEASVLEVILDPGAADPADPAVDDGHLAVVDVPEPAKIPANLSATAERALGDADLRRAHDTDLDTGGREAFVELP